jgi:hypothetical protein
MATFVEWLRARGFPYCPASLSLLDYGPDECFVKVGFARLTVNPDDRAWLKRDLDFQQLPPGLW